MKRVDEGARARAMDEAREMVRNLREERGGGDWVARTGTGPRRRRRGKKAKKGKKKGGKKSQGGGAAAAAGGSGTVEAMQGLSLKDKEEQSVEQEEEEEEDEECAICFGELQREDEDLGDDTVETLACGHEFHEGEGHSSCSKRWTWQLARDVAVTGLAGVVSRPIGFSSSSDRFFVVVWQLVWTRGL